MAEGKYGLSETLQLLERRVRALTGHDITLALELDTTTVRAGEAAHLRAIIRSLDTPRTLDYVVLALDGFVQTDAAWRRYTESAEVAQETPMAANTELVLPATIHIPEHAVLTADGARWTISARVALDNALDATAEVDLEIVSGPEV